MAAYLVCFAEGCGYVPGWVEMDWDRAFDPIGGPIKGPLLVGWQPLPVPVHIEGSRKATKVQVSRGDGTFRTRAVGRRLERRPTDDPDQRFTVLCRYHGPVGFTDGEVREAYERALRWRGRPKKVPRLVGRKPD